MAFPMQPLGSISAAEFQVSGLHLLAVWNRHFSNSDAVGCWDWVPAARFPTVFGLTDLAGGYLAMEGVKRSVPQSLQPRSGSVNLAGGAVEESDGDLGYPAHDAATLVTAVPLEDYWLYDYHIVHSEVYSCPMLLLRARLPDGRQLSLAEVVDALGPESRQLARLYPGAFMTHQEHPYLQKPWLALHPCETPSIMSLLLSPLEPKQAQEQPHLAANGATYARQSVGLPDQLRMTVLGISVTSSSDSGTVEDLADVNGYDSLFDKVCEPEQGNGSSPQESGSLGQVQGKEPMQSERLDVSEAFLNKNHLPDKGIKSTNVRAASTRRRASPSMDKSTPPKHGPNHHHCLADVPIQHHMQVGKTYGARDYVQSQEVFDTFHSKEKMEQVDPVSGEREHERIFERLVPRSSVAHATLEQANMAKGVHLQTNLRHPHLVEVSDIISHKCIADVDKRHKDDLASHDGQHTENSGLSVNGKARKKGFQRSTLVEHYLLAWLSVVAPIVGLYVPSDLIKSTSTDGTLNILQT